MTLALQMASDRLADAGYPVAAAYDTTNIQTMCGRFSLMNKSFYQIDDLEFIVAISFDYWTRDIAENVIRSAKTCGDAEHYVGSLIEQWPRIQEKQTTVTAIKTERDRVLAMPLTFATLIETKNAQPDRQKVNIRHGEQDILTRFFGKPLDARRDALFDAAMNEINNSVASYEVEHPESAKELSKNCEQLRYLDGLSDQRAKQIGEACTSALNAIAQKQAEDGIERINTALQAVEQSSGASDEARQVCQTLGQAALLRDAIPPLRDACEAAERTLKQKEEAQRCIVVTLPASAKPGVAPSARVRRSWSKQRPMPAGRWISSMTSLPVAAGFASSTLSMMSRASVWPRSRIRRSPAVVLPAN